MHTRDAKNHEEVWLLDRLDDYGFEDPAFRSRDYVLAVDEATNERAGFARFRVHTPDDTARVCEFTNIGVLDDWRGRGVGAHLLAYLVADAREQGIEEAYALTDEPAYLDQFGFERVDEAELPPPLGDRLAATRESQPDAEALCVAFDAFEVPERLQRRFAGDDGSEDADAGEDFGIDSDTATYKYDTGG
ncbi:GNAT family N-acetyltransferase [Halobacterium salinarum]|uniref:GNAT family N-acetyltransferase n=1 Tax=Halobacterium TaxID=2239 RepID=UPI001963E2D6|nr:MULTISPECIES: GNAT family N-acetyltransferase [Halobacterium]MCF2164058.1 GNAT family N-acetyltransferase [Halobacterium salinarum]MCF2168788.1 GNAT family N-acetyltransferase [Halobacterium salinarum]MCF2239329.1 GNAT family N-acetyltransferase [Halobacterium salinarum]MDL0139340.1 GNAT family N-acetyltransferase [Halobacterium salinarum]QRY23069.1 GNAT family N-acetyltransferase [Halobacterium sp. GSL-19]